jgi:hypothetical protein
MLSGAAIEPDDIAELAAALRTVLAVIEASELPAERDQVAHLAGWTRRARPGHGGLILARPAHCSVMAHFLMVNGQSFRLSANTDIPKLERELRDATEHSEVLAVPVEMSSDPRDLTNVYINGRPLTHFLVADLPQGPPES